MTEDHLFTLAHAIAMPAWACLLLAPAWDVGTRRYAGQIAPAALAVLYLALLLTGAPVEGGGFGSLDQVAALFRDRHTVLAGWVHYLCFDLLIGGWQVRDARRRGLPHLAVVPCLLGTLLFGPIGWLSYFLLSEGVRARRAPTREAKAAPHGADAR
jgi:hypothetical protein